MSSFWQFFDSQMAIFRRVRSSTTSQTVVTFRVGNVIVAWQTGTFGTELFRISQQGIKSMTFYKLQANSHL